MAVVAVVCYHFGLPGATGGFIGVDVFFVISGYLMTGIISSGEVAGRFSLGQFYLARARRIVPALTILCLALLAYGWFFLPPFDYREMARQVGASLLFISNQTYLNEAGYFDAGAREKWLLHTWSLSVEWQFYLVYPVLMAACYRFLSRRLLASVLSACFMASLLLALWLAYARPAMGFFIFPARAWEMLAGGLVYLHGREVCAALGKTRARGLEAAGLALLAIALLFVDAATPWPGPWALLPVLGASLVLATDNREHSIAGWRPLREIGRWSYSIYLWHWPIVVAFDQADLLQLPLAVGLGLGLSVFAGALSFHLVEQPFRRIISAQLPSRAALASVALVALAFLPALAIYSGKGLRELRFAGNPALVEVQAIEKYPPAFRGRYDYFYRMGSCFLSPQQGAGAFGEACIPQGARWMLWGDSHGAHLWPGLESTLGKAHVMQLTASGCPPLLGVEFPKRPECRHINDYALEVARRQRPEWILLAGAWVAYDEQSIRRGIDTLLTELRGTSDWSPRILLIGSVPHWQRSLPSMLTNDLLAGYRERYSRRGMSRTAEARDTLVRSIATEHRVEFFSPLDHACNAQGCVRFFGAGADMVPFAIDDAHLSDAGSGFIVTRLVSELGRDRPPAAIFQR